MQGENLVTIYRKNASYCRVKAARTHDAEDKAKWLEFAEKSIGTRQHGEALFERMNRD